MKFRKVQRRLDNRNGSWLRPSCQQHCCIVGETLSCAISLLTSARSVPNVQIVGTLAYDLACCFYRL